MTGPLLVGVDGGGTTTRAAVATGDGHLQGYAERGGGNPEHNELAAARENVRSALTASLTAAGRSLGDVDALTAGLAGLDTESDREWAEAFLAIDELACEPKVVNDAVVAHAGALGSEPGIVAICGTGSIVLGVDARGDRVRNYDFDHYADAAARHLGRRFAHELLAGRWGDADRQLVMEILDSLAYADVDAVRRAVTEEDHLAADHTGNSLDTIAPRITRGAENGVPIAERVCSTAAADVVLGIDLVAESIDLEPVSVAFLGSVARSRGMRDQLATHLAEASGTYDVVEPVLSPVAGAVLSSLERADGGVDRSTAVAQLSEYEPCRIE